MAARYSRNRASRVFGCPVQPTEVTTLTATCSKAMAGALPPNASAGDANLPRFCRLSNGIQGWYGSTRPDIRSKQHTIVLANQLTSGVSTREETNVIPHQVVGRPCQWNFGVTNRLKPSSYARAKRQPVPFRGRDTPRQAIWAAPDAPDWLITPNCAVGPRTSGLTMTRQASELEETPPKQPISPVQGYGCCPRLVNLKAAMMPPMLTICPQAPSCPYLSMPLTMLLPFLLPLPPPLHEPIPVIFQVRHPFLRRCHGRTSIFGPFMPHSVPQRDKGSPPTGEIGHGGRFHPSQRPGSPRCTMVHFPSSMWAS